MPSGPYESHVMSWKSSLLSDVLISAIPCLLIGLGVLGFFTGERWLVWVGFGPLALLAAVAVVCALAACVYFICWVVRRFPTLSPAERLTAVPLAAFVFLCLAAIAGSTSLLLLRPPG